ncbi:uncharacterized protein LOC133873585 [Alnus glutinosa]|uniref:uncharacterized protein LOC133873585 n=1 Tax=Alnus glutinosa TaxID=3517 RepID=UPI002D76FAD1|nr:uncharacterized protein LOC133873585 [Alnus glutinosa]
MAPSSTSSTASSFKESWDIINGHEDHNNNGTEDILVTTGCSTPKAQRFRIPEMSSCPPPPKKRRGSGISVRVIGESLAELSSSTSTFEVKSMFFRRFMQDMRNFSTSACVWCFL